MKYSTNFYYDDYEIIKLGSHKCIHCTKSIEELDVEYRFDTKTDTKNLIKTILTLNLESEKDILDFTSYYGLLINIQNTTETPTICGKPVPKKIYESIMPATTGFFMPLDIFKYFIELIRNILHLSTEILLYDNYYKRTGLTMSANPDYIDNILNVTKYFLLLLYQPYAIFTTVIGGINFVFEGHTPLSRFAYNFHEALSGFLIPAPPNYIQQYNHSLLDLCNKNLALQQEFYSRTDETITSESDIPKLILADSINMIYTMNREDYETFILSDDYCSNSPRKRQIPILSARNELKNHFDTTDSNYVSFSMSHSIAPEPQNKDTFISPVLDTMYYKDILNMLIDLEKYFVLDYQNPNKFKVILKNDVKPNDVLPFIKSLSKKGKQLILDTINSFTSNVNYRMDIDENGQYSVRLVSDSLLQSIFFKMTDILNSYDVTICKYRHCKNPVFSLKSRPAQCCCHTHLTSYLRYKERHQN